MNDQFKSNRESSRSQRIRIYCDGAGARPDGTGSAYAWLREDTGKKKICRCDWLTSNQAEYEAVLAALESLPDDSDVLILTDSQLVVSQLSGDCRTKDPKLLKLRTEIRRLVRDRKLHVRFRWVPRRENLAGKLI